MGTLFELIFCLLARRRILCLLYPIWRDISDWQIYHFSRLIFCYQLLMWEIFTLKH